ncbi:dienelactone hydrolase family protein [Hyalangium rubrum]|uniref:Prolyl oligopeptidase family serine peptidase n=1 Tax=Hyalangium rubrum TaxID=3103134 RepID=A0ABU5H4I3_9BACT|nr:prolyl oligopeptidase family serine peptidase [Hyalangium sp. s54d21]MDY7228398.1 prolyl oligopeptidase family serine peptidase [Hyalangium sp. s54d21]
MRASALPAVFLVAACIASPPSAWGAGPDDEFKARIALFTYDTQAPFKLQEVSVEKRGGATVRDITFVAAPDREPVKAFLVVPDGAGPFAGVLWVHWLGEPKTTNRTQFLNEAVSLASRGVVSLLVDAMWSTPKWYGSRVPEQDYENSQRQVIALRRAMELLLSQPQVDKARVGFVGHDYGAMYGMLAAGVAPRAKTYVYIAAAPSLSDWAFFGKQPLSKADYLRQNAVLEPSDYLRQVKNASTLFQFGKQDEYVSHASTAILFGAAQSPKERRFYEAEHSMTPAKIAEERDAWLLKELAPPAAR